MSDLCDIIKLRNRYYRDLNPDKCHLFFEYFKELFDDLDDHIRNGDIINCLKILVQIFCVADDNDLIPQRGSGTIYPGYHPTKRLLIKYELIDPM